MTTARNVNKMNTLTLFLTDDEVRELWTMLRRTISASQTDGVGSSTELSILWQMEEEVKKLLKTLDKAEDDNPS